MKTNEVYELKSLFNDHHNNLSVPMIRLFGLDAAVLLSEIYSQWRMKQKKDQSINTIDLYVASTQFDTGLTPVRQRKALKILSDYGIISVFIWGYPKRRRVRLNAYAIGKLKCDLKADKDKVKEFIELQKVIGAKNREIIEQKQRGDEIDYSEYIVEVGGIKYFTGFSF